MSRRTIFISCGQWSSEERDLGLAIAELVDSVPPFHGYFAQRQATLQGLSDNILNALSRSVGLVAVLHPRGEVARPDGTITRGSVWVEQEIAIGAFIQHTRLPEYLFQGYAHRSVGREGIRDNLIANLHSFDSSTDVLTHLKTKLGEWARAPQPKSLEEKAAHAVSMACHRWKNYSMSFFTAIWDIDGKSPHQPPEDFKGDIWDVARWRLERHKFGPGDFGRAEALFTTALEDIQLRLDRVTNGFGDRLPLGLRQVLASTPTSLDLPRFMYERARRFPHSVDGRELNRLFDIVFAILGEIDREARAVEGGTSESRPA